MNNDTCTLAVFHSELARRPLGQGTARGRCAILTRRAALLSTVSALVIARTDNPSFGWHTVVLSEESLTVAYDLVAKGYHQTIQEVVSAAIELMMERDGWRRSG